MDKRLLEKMEQKINETFLKIDEIREIAKYLDETYIDKNSFSYGIVIGRLYNSFYYQCRRILKRDPTNDEFAEFRNLLESNKSNFLKKLNLE